MFTLLTNGDRSRLDDLNDVLRIARADDPVYVATPLMTTLPSSGTEDEVPHQAGPRRVQVRRQCGRAGQGDAVEKADPLRPSMYRRC